LLSFGVKSFVFHFAIQEYTYQDIQNCNFFYGCETWSVIFREKLKLRVLENWVLREIFGPKRGEVTG